MLPLTPHCAELAGFRALADLLPDVLTIFDSTGRITFNSAACESLHGYSAEAMVGRSTFDLIHPEDRELVRRAFAEVLAQPGGSGCVRYRFRNHDGSYTWMEASGRNELHNPALNGVVCISRDISTQIALEQLKCDEAQRFCLGFTNSPQPMLIFVFENGQILEANLKAQQLYGYSLDEFRRMIVDSLRPEAGHPSPATVKRHLRDNTDARIEGLRTHRTRDGRSIEVEVAVQRLEWTGHSACLLLVHDVTEQRELQTKLQQTQKLESLGLLAGGIAHDFNNLLTAIMGHASVAADLLPSDSPAHESLRLLEETSQRAATLCRQMLAYSGRGQFTAQLLDLSRFIRSTVDLLKSTLRPHVVLRLDLAPGLPALLADPAQLQQVAMNLVLNAAEAIGDAHGEIRISTALTQVDRALLETMFLAPQLTEGAYLALQVADNGCGMSPETTARVFDPFFSTKFAGRGLGMAAVLGIVRGHNGAIRVESTPGRGTTFTILLPASDQPLADAGDIAPPPLATPVRARTVLVVDDEDCVRRTVQSMLQRSGIRVLLADNGRTGLELFASAHPEIDAVLLDLTMPEMDGRETMRDILAIDPAAQVVLMSGFDEASELSTHGHLGHRGFVQKPFTLQILLEKLHGMLA